MKEKDCFRCDWDGIKCREAPDIPDGYKVIHFTTPDKQCTERTILGQIKHCPILNLERRFARTIREVRKEFNGG